MARRRGTLRVGTSGWSYSHWRGVLYPPGMRAAGYLAHYARVFATAEINSSFYHAPRPETYRKWASAAPEGFVFAVKAHRGITHERRLQGVETEWHEFVSNALALGGMLGPVLVQFPPSFACRPELLEEFLRGHREAFGDMVRLAFEFRHASWFGGEAAALLRAHGAAMVVADSSRYPRAPLEAAAPFVYLRFHGPGELFASSYTEEQLHGWARGIRRRLDEGSDVYAYFNNDAGGCAVHNALRLRELAAG